MTGWIAFGTTDIGLLRERNEDAYALDGALGCYLVADGMGGHRGGDVASATARDAALNTLRAGAERLADDPAAGLARAICAANAAVHHAAGRDPALHGMGTTLSLLWLGDDGEAAAAHVGDSRIYRLDGERLTQITVDHTQAEALVGAGYMTREEARHSPAGHMLTRGVGLDAGVEVDAFAVDAAAAHAFLLCSDGLTGMVADDAIASILRGHAGDPAAACEALIDAAITGGGHDNVTVVVVYRRER
ncbi:MAG: protein phosphatase 2C domain-containing protein [Alphaproteobacteria bacterium]